MDHGLDILARFIDLAVDIALTIEPRRVRRHRLAVEVQLDDVRPRHECRRHGPRHEEMARIRHRTGGRMPKTVEYPLVGEDVAGGDEILDPRLVRVTALRGLALRGLRFGLYRHGRHRHYGDYELETNRTLCHVCMLPGCFSHLIAPAGLPNNEGWTAARDDRPAFASSTRIVPLRACRPVIRELVHGRRKRRTSTATPAKLCWWRRCADCLARKLRASRGTPSTKAINHARANVFLKTEWHFCETKSTVTAIAITYRNHLFTRLMGRASGG